MSDQSSEVPSYSSSSPVRTLAVRINDDLRAQLDLIAQLNDRSVTEEIRLALEDWVERSKSDPKVLKRAEILNVTASDVSTPVLIGRFEVRDGFGDTIHVRPLTQTSAGMLSFGLSEAQLGHSRAVADPALAESPNVMRALHHIIGEDREFFVSENQALN